MWGAGTEDERLRPCCRLNALSPDLQAREREVNSLRDRVRAELESACEMAAVAERDRREVGGGGRG